MRLTKVGFLDIQGFMYIKSVVKRNKKSKKRYRYLHLVESIRTKKGPRQRLILNLGSIDIPKHKHKELSDCIEKMLSGQNGLFNDDPIIEKHAKSAARSILQKRSRDAAMDKISDACSQNGSPRFQNVDVSSFQAELPRSIGPEYVCHSIWTELEINNVVLLNGVLENSLALIEAIVIARLADPGSERYTKWWAENRSAVFELLGMPAHRSLNSYYRAGDTLFRFWQALERHLSVREKELFGLTERMGRIPQKWAKCILFKNRLKANGQAIHELL